MDISLKQSESKSQAAQDKRINGISDTVKKKQHIKLLSVSVRGKKAPKNELYSSNFSSQKAAQNRALTMGQSP